MADSIAEKIESLLRPTVESFGISLWDVEYVKEGSAYLLRLTIDKPSGVDLEDCEKVHHAVDPVLDEADPIEGPYTLEVTSPGLERHLRKPAHYLASIGSNVEVSLYSKIGDKKKYSGKLLSFSEEDSLSLETENGAVILPLDKIAKAKTVFTW